MAETNINAYCSICGKGYHLCQTCSDQKMIKPWRTITDSIEHFKIYTAIHGYTISKDKETAKNELQKCDLTGLEEFNLEIKSVIKEIMKEPIKIKPVTKVKKIKVEDKTEIENNNEY